MVVLACGGTFSAFLRVCVGIAGRGAAVVSVVSCVRRRVLALMMLSDPCIPSPFACQASKKRITFKFCFLGGPEHTVTLIHSVVSGKKRIELDGVLVYEGKEVGNESTWVVVSPTCALSHIRFTTQWN